MNKVSLLVCYFIVTPCIILLALVFSLFITYQTNPHYAHSFLVTPRTTAYAALPTNQNSALIQTTIVTSDARNEIVRQFFAHYHSPLVAYADDVVQAADQYGLDYRLIPAIAMQESNLCKVIPVGSNNCWGFGIYGKTVTTFPDYGQAIWTVTKALATRYKARGLVTPEQIMTMWNPSSNGSWAHGVNVFMQELQ